MEQDISGLGVRPQNVVDKTNMRYENLRFNIDGKVYVIKQNSEDNFDSLVTFFKDDEFKGSGSGTFTYVIGTQFNIDTMLRTITKNEYTPGCDISNMHIWSKKAVTVQEIGSKHGSILDRLIDNYRKIIDNLRSDNLDMTLMYDNSIDQLYYSGEMKYDLENDTIYVNFLSGTYMTGIIDPLNPPRQTIDCITSFFKNIIGINNVIVDTSGRTFITETMTIEQLNQYVNNGMEVYVFDNERDADIYNNKSLEIGRKAGRRRNLINIMNKSPTDKLKQEIEQLTNEIAALEAIQAVRYYPKSFSGGKKTRFRRRCKRCNCVYTKKYKKYKRNHRNKNKNKNKK